MKRSELVFGLLRIAVDAVTVFVALLLAWWLRMHNIDLIPWAQLLEPAKTMPDLTYYIRSFLIPTVIVFLIIAASLKLYLMRITLSFFREEAIIILTTIVWVGMIMGWFFFVQKQLFYSRILLIHATFFVAGFVTLGHVFLMLAQRALLKKGIGVRTVLSLGKLPLSLYIEQYIKRDPRYRYIGHRSQYSASLLEFDEHEIDLILQTDPSSSEETNSLIDFCRSNQIGYAFLPPVLTDVPHLLSFHRFGSVPILKFQPTPLDGWGSIFKRAMDTICALIALIMLSPLFLIIAIVIKLDSRGPVFYKSRRMGRRKQFIAVIKFRSMVKNADELKEDLEEQSHRNDGPLFKIKNDPRITKFGKFLRRFSLDELPQLINVLYGELSLVGPRPHLPEEVAKYTDFQHRVFAIKPGITGLAQISGRSNLTFNEEVRLDLQYIEEWSPWMDLWILWRTIGVVLKGDGAD